MKSPLSTHAASPAELKERVEAERRGSPYLVYRDAEARQRLVELGEGVERVAVGRRKGSDVALEWDEEVSRLHALLERVGGEWTVVDDGLSHNGTFLGTARVTGRRRLADGDVLRFGSTLVAFCDPTGAGTGPTAHARDAAAVARLSDAQRRVLVALCRPYRDGPEFATPATNKQIADELVLSIGAVKSHLRALFEKFAIGDVPQNRKRALLAERALTAGLVTERDLRD